MFDKREVNKKCLRIGGYTVIICVLAAAGVILFNLLAGLIPAGIAKADTSRSGFYTFTESTKQLVRGLDRDVELYLISEYGNEDNYILRATESLCALSPRLDFETVPAGSEKIKEYLPDGCSENSVLAVCGGKSRLADINGIYSYTPDYESGTYKVNFNYENELYSAINYVSREKDTVAYYTAGNGESVFSASLLSKLSTDNIEYRTHDLKSSVPADADCLVISSPTSDLTAAQADNLKRYLEKGGKLFLVFNPSNIDFPNMNALLAGYGLMPGAGIIIDENADNVFSVGGQSYPYLIYPTAKDAAPASELYGTGLKVLIQMSNGIFYTGEAAPGVEVTELLSGGDSTFMRPFGSQNKEFVRSSGDTAGPFCISALIKKDDSEIIWIASTGFTDDTSESYSGGTNSVYISACMRYLTKSPGSGAEAKPFGRDTLEINGVQKGAATVLFAVLVPSAFLICGAYVTRKRKNR